MSAQIRLFWGAVAIAFAPIFVKIIDLGSTTVGFYRCLFGALLLAMLWLWGRRGQNGDVQSQQRRQRELRRAWPYLALAGAVFAADLAIWHRSVVIIGAGIATVLANTQVIFLAIFGIWFMRERPGWKFYLSLPLAFGGAILLVGFARPEEMTGNYWEGVLCGAVTGLVYATYILSLRRAGSLAPNLDLRWKMMVVSFVSAIGLGVIAWLEGVLTWPQPKDWLNLFALAAVSQVIGWLLITQNLPMVTVSRAGLIICAQPALATILGVLLLHEHLTYWQWLGVAISLVGIYLGSTRERLKTAPAEARSTP